MVNEASAHPGCLQLIVGQIIINSLKSRQHENQFAGPHQI